MSESLTCRFWHRSACRLASLAISSLLATASLAVAPDFTRVSPLYRFPVHASPDAIAVGDLDGDGNSDAVTANPDSNDVAILLGRGDGTLEHASYVPVGIGPVRLALADFNGDGSLDAVVVNRGGNSVSILLGDGVGGFGSPANYPVGTSPGPLVVLDINHDGRVDVAVVNQKANNVSVLISNGDGTFAPAAAFAVGFDPNSIVASDFDADGHVDFAIANDRFFLDWTDDVSILYGIGDGTFAPKRDYPADLNPQGLVSGDFDNDGRIDLGVINTGYDTVLPMTWVQAVSILRNTGARTFAPPLRTALPFIPASMAPGDFNGDNRLDLALSHARGVSILPGAGDGSFGSPIVGGALAGSLDVAVTDWNGDGISDLAFAGYKSVWIALGRGDGTFVNYEQYARIPFLLAADFNGDGRQDVALLDDWYSTVAVRLGNGDGTFGAPLSRTVGRAPQHAVTADFNGDGRADLAFTQNNMTSLGILIGNGDGTFGPLMSLPYEARSVASGDFDGDGDTDLALTQRWSVAVLLANGDGTFASPATYSSCPMSDWIATGDFNGDSRTDLAVFGVNCGVGIRLGQGNGTFGAAVNRGSMSCGTVLGLRAADFNSDGRSDVLIFGGQSGACNVPVLSILLGGGDWSSVSPSNLGSGREPVIADFDGDGRRDIAYLNLAQLDDVSVIVGRPDGSFGSPVLFDSGTSALAGATGDFNGDAKPDLVYSTAFSSQLAVLLNRSNSMQLSSIIPTVGETTGGDVVTITGVTLGGTTTVAFGVALAPITANTPTSIIVTTPPHSVGPVDVTVTSAAGSVTSLAAFTYAKGAAAAVAVPTLSEFLLLALAATLLAIAGLRLGR